MADLIGSGVPIEGEAGVGYLMREGYDLPPLVFTADEIGAVTAGARMIRPWGGANMAAAAEEALVKIAAVLPDEAKSRTDAVGVHVMNMPGIRPNLRARIDQAETASNTHERERLVYADEVGAKSERKARPLGLWFWERSGRWSHSANCTTAFTCFVWTGCRSWKTPVRSGPSRDRPCATSSTRATVPATVPPPFLALREARQKGLPRTQAFIDFHSRKPLALRRGPRPWLRAKRACSRLGAA